MIEFQRYFLIPQQFALFVIQMFNYVQHVETATGSEWNHSRNFVSPVLNALLFTPASLLMRGRAAVPYLRRRWKRGAVGGVCSFASYALALWAMTHAPVASVAALRETSVVFGALLAAFLLKERITPVRGAAVGLVALGAALIKLL